MRTASLDAGCRKSNTWRKRARRAPDILHEGFPAILRCPLHTIPHTADQVSILGRLSTIMTCTEEGKNHSVVTNHHLSNVLNYQIFAADLQTLNSKLVLLVPCFESLRQQDACQIPMT